MSGLARCLLLCSLIWASFCSVFTWGEAASPLRTGPLARWSSCCCGFITRRRFYSSVRNSPSSTPASIVRISNRRRAREQSSWRRSFPSRATRPYNDDMNAGQNASPINPQPEMKARSVSSYVLLAAALFVFVETFSLLSPILLSFLLILLISLAVNPVISRMRALTGGRKVSTALIAAAFVTVIALTGLAFFGPMKSSVAMLSEQFPAYWARLQKPLIKMEQQSARSEEKIQAEITAEIPRAPTTAVKSGTAQTTEPAPAKHATEPGSLRSSLSQTLQGVAGRFTAVAFNAAQILVVLVTVFFGVTFTLMNPRPIFGAIFSLVPERHHAQTLAIAQRIGKFVPSWALATLLAMLTVGLLVFVLR